MLLVDNGEIEQKWWDVLLQEKRGIKKAIADFSPVGDITKTINSVKWVGVVALAGVGLYFAWPILNKLRKRSK